MRRFQVATRIVRWIVLLLLLAFFGNIVWMAAQPYFILRRIETGMSREQAIAAVGQPPRSEQAMFPLCDGAQRGWYGDCTALLRSGASRYLVWKFGIDELLVVGADAEGKIVFRGLGST